jgi:hypothetical protein
MLFVSEVASYMTVKPQTEMLIDSFLEAGDKVSIRIITTLARV